MILNSRLGDQARLLLPRIVTTALLTAVLIGCCASAAEGQAQWTTNGNNINNTNNGNVGIGTTAPSTKLEVVGNINAKLAIDAPATTDVRHIFNGASAWLGQDATNGELNFGYNLYYNSGFKYRVAAQAANIRMYQGAFQFQTAAAGSAGAAITWTDTAVILANGNVGVGTPNPSSAVHITKSFAPSYGQLVLQDPNANDASLTSYMSFYGSTSRRGLFGFGRFAGASDPELYLVNEQTSGGFRFRNSSSDLVTIQNGGNVGIGTTTPGAKLAVNGNTNVIGNVTVTGTGNITATGTIEGGNIKAKYQDVAEWVPSTRALPA